MRKVHVHDRYFDCKYTIFGSVMQLTVTRGSEAPDRRHVPVHVPTTLAGGYDYLVGRSHHVMWIAILQGRVRLSACEVARGYLQATTVTGHGKDITVR